MKVLKGNSSLFIFFIFAYATSVERKFKFDGLQMRVSTWSYI